MDNNSWNFSYKVEGPAAIPFVLLCCACCIAPIVFVVYLGVYSFNNPDNEAWLGVTPAGEYELYKDEASGAGSTDLVDIHSRFVIWFTWGFLQNLVAPLASGLLVGMGLMLHPILGSVCMCLLGSAMSCGGIAWWITGIVWRFRSDGKFACGDVVPEGMTEEAWQAEITADDSLYQHSTGNFLFIYYIICWSLAGAGCLCSILASICACCRSK